MASVPAWGPEKIQWRSLFQTDVRQTGLPLGRQFWGPFAIGPTCVQFEQLRPSSAVSLWHRASRVLLCLSGTGWIKWLLWTSRALVQQGDQHGLRPPDDGAKFTGTESQGMWPIQQNWGKGQLCVALAPLIFWPWPHIGFYLLLTSKTLFDLWPESGLEPRGGIRNKR